MYNIGMDNVKLSDIRAAQNNLKTMHQKYIEFLDNPEMVALFNEHIQTITEKYSTITAEDFEGFKLAERVRAAIDAAIISTGNTTEQAPKQRDTPYIQRLKQNTAMTQALRINPERIEEYKQIATRLAVVDNPNRLAAIHNHEITISYHLLDWSPELQQNLFAHELAHAIHDVNIMYPEEGTTDDTAQALAHLSHKEWNYARELGADTLGNVLAPPQHKSEMMDQLNNTKKQLYTDKWMPYILAQNPYEDPAIIQRACDELFEPTDPDMASDTHPSHNERINNTGVIIEKIAAFNENATMGNKPEMHISTLQNKLTA